MLRMAITLAVLAAFVLARLVFEPTTEPAPVLGLRAVDWSTARLTEPGASTVSLVGGVADLDTGRAELLRVAYGEPYGPRYGEVALMLLRRTAPDGSLSLEVRAYRYVVVEDGSRRLAELHPPTSATDFTPVSVWTGPYLPVRSFELDGPDVVLRTEASRRIVTTRLQALDRTVRLGERLVPVGASRV